MVILNMNGKPPRLHSIGIISLTEVTWQPEMDVFR